MSTAADSQCKCQSTKNCCIALCLGLLACVFARLAALHPHRTLNPRTTTLEAEARGFDSDVRHSLQTVRTPDPSPNPQSLGATSYVAKAACETLDDTNVPHVNGSGVITVCCDVPGWSDSEGRGCSEYSKQQYCNAGGGFGAGWRADWGAFSDYGKHGHIADSACCACGRSEFEITFHPQKAHTMDTVAGVGKCLLACVLHTRNKNFTVGRVWNDPMEGGEHACHWRVQVTAVRNVFRLENVNWAGVYLSLNSRGADIQVASDPQAATRWHVEKVCSPNAFRLISKQFAKRMVTSTNTPLKFTQKDSRWDSKIAYGNASKFDAFAVLCCNWNTKHKDATFWSKVEGGDMGPVGALLQQLQRLEKCSWFRDDASLRIVIFYERPPSKLRGLSKKDYWSLLGIRDRIDVVDVSQAFQRPVKKYLFRDGLHKFQFGYRVANHFWSQRIFWVPEMKNLRYLLRLDEDSVLRCEGRKSAFDAMREGGYIYGYYNLMTDDFRVSKYFGKVVLKYLRIKKLEPAWNLDNVTHAWKYAPTFYNDFEIMYIPHFRSRAVQRFTDHIIEEKGIYEWRWADGSVRFGQVAITVPPQKVKCFLGNELDYFHQNVVPDRKQCSICLGRFVISGHFSGLRPQQWCRDCVGHGLSRMESFGFIEEPEKVWKSRHSPLARHAKQKKSWLESYVTTSFKCPKGKSVGSGNDGGKRVCNPHRIVDGMASGEGCLMYSIRSGKDRSFEEGVFEQISKACVIHVFSIGTPSVPGRVSQEWLLDTFGAESSVNRRFGQNLSNILLQLNHARKQIQVDILHVDCKECGIQVVHACRSILSAGLEVRQILLTLTFDQESSGYEEQAMLKKFLEFLSSRGYRAFHQDSQAPNHATVSFLKLRNYAGPWCGPPKDNECNHTVFRCLNSPKNLRFG